MFNPVITVTKCQSLLPLQMLKANAKNKSHIEKEIKNLLRSSVPRDYV